MNQNVIQVKVPKGLFTPLQHPCFFPVIFKPLSTIHFRLVQQFGSGRGTVDFDHRFAHWIEIDCRSPLQTVAGEPPLFSGDIRKLHDIKLCDCPIRQVGQAGGNLAGADGMEHSVPRFLFNDPVAVSFAHEWFVPVFDGEAGGLSISPGAEVCLTGDSVRHAFRTRVAGLA